MRICLGGVMRRGVGMMIPRARERTRTSRKNSSISLILKDKISVGNPAIT